MAESIYRKQERIRFIYYVIAYICSFDATKLNTNTYRSGRGAKIKLNDPQLKKLTRSFSLSNSISMKLLWFSNTFRVGH